MGSDGCGYEGGEVLAIRASRTGSSLDAYIFLRKVLRTCMGKPLILVDKGPWYPWALNRLGLRWEHVTFGMRNRIERWFRTLKRRTKVFYNNALWLNSFLLELCLCF